MDNRSQFSDRGSVGRGRAPKRAARTRVAKRVAAETAPKKRVTKTKVKRAVSKKSPIKAPEADVIEEPVPGVAVS